MANVANSPGKWKGFRRRSERCARITEMYDSSMEIHLRKRARPKYRPRKDPAERAALIKAIKTLKATRPSMLQREIAAALKVDKAVVSRVLNDCYGPRA